MEYVYMPLQLAPSALTQPILPNWSFNLFNVNLGASTNEAQENVALQVAEQMSDYLTKGAVQNALNMPSISAEEAPKLTPFVKLAELLDAPGAPQSEDGPLGEPKESSACGFCVFGFGSPRIEVMSGAKSATNTRKTTNPSDTSAKRSWRKRRQNSCWGERATIPASPAGSSTSAAGTSSMGAGTLIPEWLPCGSRSSWSVPRMRQAGGPIRPPAVGAYPEPRRVCRTWRTRCIRHRTPP